MASKRWEMDERRGNCYYAAEALFHILGGKRAGWKPMRLRMEAKNGFRESHWFLKHKSGMILDPSKRQFRAKDWWPKPDYSTAKGCGFMTKHPSRGARDLMERLTWHIAD